MLTFAIAWRVDKQLETPSSAFYAENVHDVPQSSQAVVLSPSKPVFQAKATEAMATRALAGIQARGCLNYQPDVST